jgi:peptidoglycan/xylan/chitin deacetylase (PgdA/CDA1 family)
MGLKTKKTIAFVLTAVLCLVLAGGCSAGKSGADAKDLDEQRREFIQLTGSRAVELTSGVTLQSIVETEGNALVSVDYPLLESNNAISAGFASFITKNVNEFHSETDSMGDPTPETGLYNLTITYKPYMVGSGILSVKFTTNSFSGKTSKSNYIDSYVYDLSTNERLGLDAVFNPAVNYIDAVASRVTDYLLRNEIIINNQDEALFAAGTAPEIQNYSNFVITSDNKIIFYFNKNTIAPAEAGTVEVCIPLSEFDDALNPAYRDMLYGQGGAPIAAEGNPLVVDSTITGEQAGASDYLSQLPMLNLEGNYMAPFTLDGIDPFSDKVIAITFDDGPSAHTPALLDALKSSGVKATFFVVGEMADIRRDTLKRAYDEGHELATHSWDHPDLMTLTVDQIMTDQYGRTNDVIEEVTGKRALFDRPPSGSMTEERAGQLGRAQIMWNNDTLDWKLRSKENGVQKIYDNIMNSGDGSIILLHDLHEASVQAAIRAIPDLVGQGYKLITISQMMQVAKARGYDVPYKFGSTIYSLANAPANDPGQPADADQYHKSTEGDTAGTE